MTISTSDRLLVLQIATGNAALRLQLAETQELLIETAKNADGPHSYR